MSQHSHQPDKATSTIAVLGATGYVGGRLVPQLLDQGWKVRAIGRSRHKLSCRPWAAHPACELAQADAQDQASLAEALTGCDAAYYLVHSMDANNPDFANADRKAAANMAAAAQETGLGRIIYLSGLAPQDPFLSKHLRSRAEVAQILGSGPVPVTTLQAAVIIGSGSASFELIRYLVDRLPIMITPKWVRTESQPIGIRDVLAYLVGCLDHEQTTGQTYDIGGPFIETYERLFRIYAQEAGLPRRLIIPVPFLSPGLSSLWLGLVSPIPVALAKPLILGLRNRAVCREHRIRKIMPRELMDCRQAIGRALEKVKQQMVDTSWSDAGSTTPPEWVACGDAPYAGGTVLDTSYRIRLDGCPEELWDSIMALGGNTGWYYADRLWGLRGWMDKMVGGVGLRRGRRDPKTIKAGDALDFWRVLEVTPPERLLLLAEMKLPGEALLEITMTQLGTGQTELTMIARFLPRGLGGLLYWYAVTPLHGLVFKGMIRELARNTHCRILQGPEAVPGKAPQCRLPRPPE